MRIPRWHRHPKLDIDLRRNSKIWAHDEYGLCSVGDLVRAATARVRPSFLCAVDSSRPPAWRCVQVKIEPCRALSKRKAHVVSAIIKKEDGSPPPDPFPKW